MAEGAARARAAIARHAPLFGGLLLLALLVRLPGYVHQLYDPDEATIADQAITLRSGGHLYVDAIDRKPPLPTYLYDASFRLLHNVDLRPVHLLAALFLAVAGCAVASDVGLRTRGERVWAGVLLVTGAVAFLPDAGQAANYAHFALAPGALAMVLARRTSGAAAFGAGVALAVAVLCRQTWLIGLLPAGFAVLLGRRWPRLIVFAGAFVLTLANVLWWLPLRDVWHWVFASNQGFLLTGPNWGMVSVSFFGGLVLLIGLHVPLVAGLLERIRSAGSVASALRVDPDLWLWWACATVAWVSGFRFFAHYWLQSLPPLAVLAAPALARSTGRIRQALAALVVAVTAFAMAAGFTPATFRTLPDATPLARYVAAHTTRDQPILVWGNFPEVQWESDRPLGGALVHSDFVTGVSGNRTLGRVTLPARTPGANLAVLSAVVARPPQLVLDTSTADIRSYGDYPLSVFPELAAYVHSRYVVAARVDRVTIYRLRQE